MSSARICSFFKRAMTSDTASGSTAITRVPSLIASNGSMPKTFETAATAGSTWTLARFTSTPSPEACAISQTAFRTPPSVASCIAQTPPLRTPTEAAANASSTVLIESNRTRARFVTSAPSFRSIRSGNVFERIAVAAIVTGHTGRYEGCAVFLRFAIDHLEHRLDLVVFDVHGQIPIHRDVLRRDARRRQVGGEDVKGEPRGPLPSILGHDVDRVRRREESPPVRKAHDADVHSVRRPHGHVFASRAQVVRDHVLEERATHLSHRILGSDRFRHGSDSETRAWSTVAPDRASTLDARA